MLNRFRKVCKNLRGEICDHVILTRPFVYWPDIELTRFPVPNDDDHKDTIGYPGLVRAADLVGQMSDPWYIRKYANLFYEFKETGEAEKLKLSTPADLKKIYPVFFWRVVHPYVKDART